MVMCAAMTTSTNWRGGGQEEISERQDGGDNSVARMAFGKRQYNYDVTRTKTALTASRHLDLIFGNNGETRRQHPQ